MPSQSDSSPIGPRECLMAELRLAEYPFSPRALGSQKSTGEKSPKSFRESET